MAMSISAHFLKLSSRRKGRRTKTRVGRSLTCYNEESKPIKVLGLQSGVERRPATSATGTQSSERYCGAKPCRHLYTIPHSLKVTRCGTSNQYNSSWRMCVKPRSNFQVPVMTRAAVFRTRCSLSVVVLGAFAISALP